MSENGFQPGPYMKRGPGALSKSDTQVNFDVYNEAISSLQQQVKDLQRAVSAAWASAQATTEGGGHAPGAPSLSASGNPVYIEDPQHPGSWVLNPVTPPDPLWWLHDNHTDQGSGDDNLMPDTVVRIALASGTNRSDGPVSVFLGLIVTTAADDLHAASVRTLQATVSLTQEDCDAGFVDVRAPSGIKVNDVVDCVLVAAWNAIGYAETDYAIGAREYIAGFGPPLPEMPVFTTIQRNAHHIKTKLVLQGPYDLTAPYTQPGCINYYDSVEVWSRDEYLDDGVTPCSGVHPDDGDAVGWEQEPNVGIKRIIRKIGQETKAGKAIANQHRGISVVVQRNNGGKKWLAFRYRDRFGRVGPWANITPTTMGIDSGTAPGYILATAAYLPGGASNPLSNAATDPAVGFWNADDDSPNTAAREVSARIRFYFTNPSTGISPVANSNNRHLSVVVREQRANGRVIRHAPTVDIENDTEAHGAETYADVHFLRKFRRGSALKIKSAAVHGNGFKHEQVFSGLDFYAGGGQIAAPQPPVVGTPTHTKMATIVPVTLPNDTTAGHLQVFVAPAGTAQDPDTYKSSYLKVKGIDIADDIKQGRLNLEVHLARPNAYKKVIALRIKSKYDPDLFSAWAFPSDTGTVPDTDDVPPVITNASLVSVEDDVPGTPGIQCDLDVTVSWTGTAKKLHVRVTGTDGRGNAKTWTKTRNVVGLTSPQSVHFASKWKKGKTLTVYVTGQNGTAFSAEYSAGSVTAGGAALPAPTAPTITAVTHTKLGTIVDVSVPADASARVLQIFKAPVNTSSTPDTAPSVWKKIYHTEIDDDVAAGRGTVSCHIARPSLSTHALIARIQSRYDRSIFSPWSVIWNGGTVPTSDDTPPASVSISLQSPLDDIPGTTKRECSLGATFNIPGGDADKVKAVFQDTSSGRQFSLEGALNPGETSLTLWLEKKLAAGHTIQCVKCKAYNGTAYVNASSLPSIVAGSGTVPSGGVPGAPALSSPYIALAPGSVGPHSAEFDVTWDCNSYPYIQKLRIQRQNVAGTQWKEVETVNVESLVKAGIGTVRIKIHWERRINNANVPQIQVAAVDSFGSTSGWYIWSNSGVIQPSPLDYYQDSQGQLQGGNVNLTVNGTTENLIAKMVCAFAGGANHIFLDADNIWPTDAIAQAALPLSSSAGIIASGRIVPVWLSTATGSLRFRLAVYFPNSLTGVGANKWAIFKADTTLDLDGGTDPGDAPPVYTEPPISGGACFAPETLTLLDDGTARAIRDIQPGDSLLGVDPVTGGLTPTPALVLSDHPESGDVDGVVLLGVRLTADHQVAGFAPGTPAAAGPWVAAIRLPAGHVLCGLVQGKLVRLEAPDSLPKCDPFHPYNLTTGTHNFFVSADGVTWLLVSNTKTLA
jgi:hypothetical protein